MKDKASDIPITTDSSDAEGDVDGLESSLDDLSAMQVGSVLQGYGAGAEDMAQSMNQASINVGQLSTNVGMAEPQMVSLINTISNATFPQNEAMAYVNALNQMGVSSDQLGESATNMDKINDATGIGYEKTMQLTASLQAVGIEGNNLPAAFNAISYAQSNLYGGTDTLTQVLKTQAGTINEYGLSIDQTTIMLAALQSQTGLTGRKLATEFSSRLKECNGDTRALEESLGLTEGTLSNASDVTGQYAGQIQTLADEEKEHKTFLDELGAAWDDLALSMSGVTEPILSLAGMGGQVMGFAMQMNGAWDLMSKFSQVGPIASALSTIKSALSGLIPTQIAEGTAGWFSIGWIALAILLGIALGLALLWLYNNCDWFREGVDNLVKALTGFVNAIRTKVKGAIDWFGNAIQSIPESLKACLDWAYNLVMSHPIVQAIIWLGDKLAWAFSALGLGQHSPGKIVKSMRQELDWTEDEINKSSLADATASLGADVSNSFNADLTTSNGAITGNGGNSIVINIDSVDSEDRIQQIVKAVEDALRFDNLTAGRSG